MRCHALSNKRIKRCGAAPSNSSNASGVRSGAHAPWGPPAHASQAKISGNVIRLSWLQSLKSWSLRQSRGGSEGFNSQVRRTVTGLFHDISPQHADFYFHEIGFRRSQRVVVPHVERQSRSGRKCALTGHVSCPRSSYNGFSALRPGAKCAGHVQAASTSNRRLLSLDDKGEPRSEATPRCFRSLRFHDGSNDRSNAVAAR